MILMQAGGIGSQIANAIKSVIIEVVNILIPIVDVVGLGMVIIGLLLALGLRQEFYGARLVVGGGLALVTTHLLIPMLIGFL